MTAIDNANQVIPLSSFGSLGHYDFGTPFNGNFLFNDDLNLNTTTGRFQVTTVGSQNDVNSDMLLLTLPGGVNRIDLTLFNATSFTGDTVNFMIANPVPEPSSMAIAAIGGLVLLGCYRRKRPDRQKRNGSMRQSKERPLVGLVGRLFRCRRSLRRPAA